MLSLTIVNEFVYENFSNVSVSKTGQHFHCRCPFCGDSKKSKSKKRFHLDYNGGNPIHNCFNCNESGSFLQLYSTIKGISINDAKKELYNYNPEGIIEVLSAKKRDKAVEELEHENFNSYILEDCIGANDSPGGVVEKGYQRHLLDFIKERNIPESTKLFVAHKGKFQGRIIIPIYDEHDDIVYFQGRRIVDSMPKKYDNPTLKKGHTILNKHKFKKDKYIVVTEGLIDALSIGDNGTSVMGKELSEDFISNIIGLSDKGVIVALDNDKDGIKSLKIFMKNNKYKKRVKYFIFPKKYLSFKDLNSFSASKRLSEGELYEFVVRNSYSYTYAYLKLHIE